MATTVANAWDSVAAATPPNWLKMTYQLVLQKCAVIYGESPSTPNHSNRVDWARKFWQPGQDPKSVLPTTALQLLHLIIAQGDVAFVVASGLPGDDALTSAIKGVIDANCPAAA